MHDHFKKPGSRNPSNTTIKPAGKPGPLEIALARAGKARTPFAKQAGPATVHRSETKANTPQSKGSTPQRAVGPRKGHR